jgi:hypothetical protein
MRQALLFTKETTPGTYNVSATSADKVNVRIVDDSAFPDRSVPNVYYVRDAAGSNRNVQADHGTMTSLLQFKTLIYPSQAKLLMPWGFNLVADGLSFKSPYTFTVDHLIQLEDAGRTVLYRRYLGATPADVAVKASNQGDAQKFMFSSSFWILGVDEAITVTDFPTPVLADFPGGKPFKFQQLAGGVSLGGTRTGFKNFDLMCKHNSKGIYDEGVYPQAIGWFGRDVSTKIDFRYKSAADRAALEGVTAEAMTVTLTDGTTTVLWDFKSTNVITAVGDSLSLSDAFYQGVSTHAMVDATAATDLNVTVTP